MKALSYYVGGIVFKAIAAVLFVILSLDVISSLVDQMGSLRGDYDIKEAAIYSLLYVPSAAVEYVPLSALVGCLIGLGMLASSSELTVMRAAGVSIAQIVWVVFKPVLVVVFSGALVAEFVAPYLDQYADSRKALAQGHRRALEGEKGLWNREGNEYMHFNAVLPNGKLFGITRYSFDSNGSLVSATFADSAIFQGDHWFQQEVQISDFENDRISTQHYASQRLLAGLLAKGAAATCHLEPRYYCDFVCTWATSAGNDGLSCLYWRDCGLGLSNQPKAFRANQHHLGLFAYLCGTDSDSRVLLYRMAITQAG